MVQLYSDDAIDFQEKVYERSGLADYTYVSDGATSLLGVRQCMDLKSDLRQA